jgi:L-2,4-diaminobutyrate transaminase
MLADKAAGAALAQMARRGVIARAMPQGDIICRAPPLCLTLEEADTSAKALKTVLG